MMTRVYRVARVLSGPSAVARIDAVDAEGHELRLEVPTGEALSAAAGRVLVLQWSLHDLPMAQAAEAAQAAQAEHPAATPGTTAAPEITVASEATGRSVDEDFMQLMGRGQRGSPQPPSRGRDHDIQDEFNMLLGSARTKGHQ
ncbi:MAG: hypothetical protein H0T76_27840 [Nannocystis sp.]|nr:hypothetical protein [Nannocystis sp.]MBA3550305.1 hypothetical protein [Nannocystis sp.]